MRAEQYVFHDDDRARVVLEFWRGKAFIHMTIKKIGMDVMREIRARWADVKDVLKTIGFDVVYAYNLEILAEQWTRFMRPLGFTEVRRQNGLVLMEAQTWKQ